MYELYYIILVFKSIAIKEKSDLCNLFKISSYLVAIWNTFPSVVTTGMYGRHVAKKIMINSYSCDKGLFNPSNLCCFESNLVSTFKIRVVTLKYKNVRWLLKAFYPQREGRNVKTGFYLLIGVYDLIFLYSIPFFFLKENFTLDGN